MSQSEAATDIEVALETLGTRYQASFSQAKNEPELRAEHAKILGKKGDLTAALVRLRDVPASDKPRVGAIVNAFRKNVEEAFGARLAQIAEQALTDELSARPYDLTLPGRLSFGRGHRHPVLRVRDELLQIFAELGFTSVPGPEVELEENNFTKLNFPPDHPATDMQDSFWLTDKVLLRTHTSNVQVREMTALAERIKAGAAAELAVVSAGAVYRRDDDVTHSPMFHQIEGFLIGPRVSLAELKGVLGAFVSRLYGETALRLRPSYFPFVEPGAEVDIGCVFCRESDGSRTSCRVCKATGWLEIAGCGMIHPEVFKHTGIDPNQVTGFAFGMGIERIAMLRYGIPNIRHLFDNDPRFLSQF